MDPLQSSTKKRRGKKSCARRERALLSQLREENAKLKSQIELLTTQKKIAETFINAANLASDQDDLSLQLGNPLQMTSPLQSPASLLSSPRTSSFSLRRPPSFSTPSTPTTTSTPSYSTLDNCQDGHLSSPFSQPEESTPLQNTQVLIWGASIPIDSSIPLRFDAKVVQIACGANHAVFLSDTHRVFALGDNQQGQLLGHPPEHLPSAVIPIELDFQLPLTTTTSSLSTLMDASPALSENLLTFRSSSVVKIFAGYTQTLAVSFNQMLCAWGALPSPVPPLRCFADFQRTNRRVSHAAFTPLGMYILAQSPDDIGEIWGHGWLDFLPASNHSSNNPAAPTSTSVSARSHYYATFTPIPLPFGHVDCVDLAASSSHCLALSRSGRLFAWGKNQHQSLGVGCADDIVSTPSFVRHRQIQGFFRKIACGHLFSVALTSHGALIVWGLRMTGEQQYAMVDMLPEKSFRNVFAGPHHVFALTQDKVYAWGRNQSMQLGLSSSSSSSNPSSSTFSNELNEGTTIQMDVSLSTASSFSHKPLSHSDLSPNPLFQPAFETMPQPFSHSSPPQSSLLTSPRSTLPPSSSLLTSPTPSILPPPPPYLPKKLTFFSSREILSLACGFNFSLAIVSRQIDPPPLSSTLFSLHADLNASPLDHSSSSLPCPPPSISDLEADSLTVRSLIDGKFLRLWNDQSLKPGPLAVQFFRPDCPPGWVRFGDLCERVPASTFSRSYPDQPLPATKMCCLVAQDHPQLLQQPLDYELLWANVLPTSQPQQRVDPVSVWRPIAPPGYVALGFALNNDLSRKPSLDVVRCVHRSLVLQASLDPSPVWTDRASPSKTGPVSFWQIAPLRHQDERTLNLRIPAGTFHAIAAWEAPKYPVTFSLQFARLKVASNASLFVPSLQGKLPAAVSHTQRHCDQDLRHIVDLVEPDPAGQQPEEIFVPVYLQTEEDFVLPLRAFRTIPVKPDTSAQEISDRIFAKLPVDSIPFPRNRYRLGIVNVISRAFYWLEFAEMSLFSLLCQFNLHTSLTTSTSSTSTLATSILTASTSTTTVEHAELVAGKCQVIFCPFEDVLALLPRTHFSKNELLHLYRLFDQAAQTSVYLDRQRFSDWWATLFPELDWQGVHSPLLVALFNSIDLDNSGVLCFEEFAKALSTICRGSFLDQAEFAFRFYSSHHAVDPTAPILTDTIVRLTQLIHQTLFHVAPNGSPFAFTPFTNYADSQSFSEHSFLDASRNDPTLAACFSGLRELLYQSILAPIESREYGELLHRPEMSGPLLKTRANKLKAAVNKRLFSPVESSWVILRHGFIAIFNAHPTNATALSPKEENDTLITIYSLADATFVPDSDGKSFTLSLPAWTRRFSPENPQQLDRWVFALQANLAQNQIHRYDSFAPIRTQVQAQFLPNGSAYFSTLYRYLKRARTRVLIADWMLSPGLYLKRGHNRPLLFAKKYRLDHLLHHIAKAGVMIYILLWANSTLLNLDSRYVTQFFQNLHPNIKILAHPNITVPSFWSHHQKFVVIDDFVGFVGGIDLCYGRFDDHRYLLLDPHHRWFPGRDYCNFNLVGEWNGPTMEPTIPRETTPRMPWHDCQVMVSGPVVVDIVHNFTQRWNHALRSNTSTLSGSSEDFIRRFNLPLLPPPRVVLSADHLPPFAGGISGLTAQVVRSCAEWSCGITRTEASIANAYLSLIANAKHYIYIENQYFISSISLNEPINRVADALYQRLRRAILNQEVFRLIVVLPVVPSGDIRTATTRFIIKHNYQTICRSADQRASIIERLQHDFPSTPIHQYVSFFALRNYDWLHSQTPVTEQIYVHSKLMIIDDFHVLIGSANINDRSMLGLRDSEIALVMSDTRESSIRSRMNGVQTRVGRFARALRIGIWRTLLGLPSNEDTTARLIDPIAQETYDLLVHSAESNAQVYHAVFTKLPSHLQSLADLDNPKDFVIENIHMLQTIQGYLTTFPTQFLIHEQNDPRWSDPEKILPNRIFI